MWKAISLAILILAAPGVSRAQQPLPLPTEAAPVEAVTPFTPVPDVPPAALLLPPATVAPSAPMVMAPTGATYFIQSRAPQAGIRKVSTRTTPAGVPAPSLMDGLNSDQLALLEKLNRVDAPRLQRLSTVVVPAAWSDNELAYSPFPQEYPWAATKAQTIVVDQGAQAFGAYEYGRLVRWGPVSTGDGGKTPAGLFQLSWRSRGHASSVDPSWYLEWYFNFIPSRGIAFHQYSLPGRAASHGCVRMLERDAQWLYDWGQARRKGAEGATVIVLGCPDVSKPWQSADFLRGGIALPDVPPSNMMECTGYSGAAAASFRKTVR